MADPVTMAVVVGAGMLAGKVLAPKAPDAPKPPPMPTEDTDLSAKQASEVEAQRRRDIRRVAAAKQGGAFQSLLMRMDRQSSGQSLVKTKSLLGE